MPYLITHGPGFHLLRTAALFKQCLTRELKEHDITPVQFAVLALLWEAGALTQFQIADLLGKDRPNITRILERMENKSLVTRMHDQEDRRVIRVAPSQRALEMRSELEALAVGFRAKALRGISEADRKTLKRILEQLSDNLQ